MGSTSIFTCGWLYGIIFADLLRDCLSLLPTNGSPERLKQLEQIQDYYSHTRVGFGPLWSQGFLAHVLALILCSFLKLSQGFTFKNCTPSICVLAIITLNTLLLERAKKTLRDAKGEVALCRAGQKIFYIHSIMAAICIVHFISST